MTSRAPSLMTAQCSHIGGDRFACNVLWMPYGIYYGFVSPETAEELVESVRQKRILLSHLRGRSCFPPFIQAAEYFLRRELGLVHVTAPSLVHHEKYAGRGFVDLSVAGTTYRVHLSEEYREVDGALSCGSGRSTGLVRDYRLFQVE